MCLQWKNFENQLRSDQVRAEYKVAPSFLGRGIDSLTDNLVNQSCDWHNTVKRYQTANEMQHKNVNNHPDDHKLIKN